MRKSEGLRTDVMMTSTRISRAGWAIALMLALGLVGCGSSSDTASKAQGKKKTHLQVSVNPAMRPVGDMVTGVSGSKSGPPVELKYELREPPEAGQLLDVDVAVVADSPSITRLIGNFKGGPGLDVVEGADLAAVEKPAPGTVIRHVVRVLAKEDGIFTVSAAVSVDLADGSLTRTFAIPVIVGDGLSDQAPKTEVAEGLAQPGSARSATGTAGPSGALKTH